MKRPEVASLCVSYHFGELVYVLRVRQVLGHALFSLLLRLYETVEIMVYFMQFQARHVLSDDPAQLLPQLLDRMIELGDMARQLSCALVGNGHKPEQATKLMEELARR